MSMLYQCTAGFEADRLVHQIEYTPSAGRAARGNFLQPVSCIRFRAMAAHRPLPTARPFSADGVSYTRPIH